MTQATLKILGRDVIGYAWIRRMCCRNEAVKREFACLRRDYRLTSHRQGAYRIQLFICVFIYLFRRWPVS